MSVWKSGVSPDPAAAPAAESAGRATGGTPVFQWISRMLSEGDGTPSTKRVCFAISITTACSLATGLFLRHGLEALAVDLMKWTLTTAGAAYAITRWAEYGGSPQTSAPSAQSGGS